MVKVETTYICPICNARYSSMERAECCEQSHPKELKIKEIRYSEGTKFPESIVMISNDGATAVYDLF